MPLEKYVPKPELESKSGKSKESNGLKKEITERIQHELELRSELREKHKQLKESRIKKAKIEVEQEDKDDDFSKTDAKKLDKKIHKERLKDYKLALKEENNIGVREEAFEEITDFKFSKEIFHHESGWLAEYNTDASKDSQSIEEFVLLKQYAELDQIRTTLAEARIGELVPKLYKDLDETKLKEKNKDISSKVNTFFKQNAESLAKLFEENNDKSLDQKKKLYKDFRESVFDEIEPGNSAEEQLISGLFDSLLDDYAAMIVAQEKIKKLNPTMVSLLLKENMTEEEWESVLKNEAKLQAKKMAEQQLVDKQEAAYAGAPAGVIDTNSIYYGANYIEQLDKSTNIQIVSLGKGEYKVIFPSNDGQQESKFTVKKVTENGVTREVFIFKDSLMDRPIVTNDRGFKSQINGLYLDHVMNETIKKGKDYLGPNLNEVLKDAEMFGLAEKLFYPAKLSEITLKPEQINVFKRLMLVITSQGNNQKGEGLYGNLLAIKTRISLLNLALTLDGGAKAKSFYDQLKTMTDLDAKKVSLEQLCKQVGVPKNSGNFTKL
ncbi:hypothetical protein IT412_00955 [Candidatus Peregrinibacteria bacterium]|nr:hypothetical protein [Candidatus Peregrinibacteria bacterium]